LREGKKAGCKKQIAKRWTAHGVTSIGNARDDVTFLGRRHVSVCGLDHVTRCGKMGQGFLPEPAEHRCAVIHVNRASVHAPIGSMPGAARPRVRREACRSSSKIPEKHGCFALRLRHRQSPRAALRPLAATLACPVALAIQSAQQAACNDRGREQK
jgi:hypothetical protein